MTVPVATDGATATGGLTGFVGLASDVLTALGEVGVAVLTLVETVFPPIPSEVILPLAGFLAYRGEMSVVLVVVAATIGSYFGALVLYWLGRRFGEERSIRMLSRLPLVDRSDFERASAWFGRHGRSAVFLGRLIPGVRSLISLPAGARGMPVGVFSLFTIAGSTIWNAALIAAGYALGTQYTVVEQYSNVLDYLVIAVIVGVIGGLVVRRIRRPPAPAAD